MHIAKLSLNPLTRLALCAAVGIFGIGPAVAMSPTVHLSIAQFPDPISTPAMIEALTVVGTKVPGVTLQITAAPFARSMAAVGDGAADLHIPMIRPPSADGLPWAPSTTAVYHVPFVLYTNKDHPVDIHNLAKYKIETEVAHVGYFDFPIVGSAGIDSSLQKVAAGRIDGFIYAGNITDPLLTSLKLTNIHREFYKMYDAVAVLPKDGHDGQVDQWLTKAVAAAQSDPKFNAAIDRLLSGYRGPDWQP